MLHNHEPIQAMNTCKMKNNYEQMITCKKDNSEHMITFARKKDNSKHMNTCKKDNSAT